MDEVLLIVLTGVFSIFTGILLFMWQQKIKENKKLKREIEEKRQERTAALENGMVCILRKHLMDEHEMWIGKRYITAKALESGLLMYKAYKSLGGNGMIDHMEEEIQELPIRD